MARPARETPVDSTGGTPVDDPGGTPVDNSVYDRLGGGWWDPDSVLVLTRTMVNPGRLPYLRRLVARLGMDPAASALLEVGCGGGHLSEELAAMGFRVTGVDPSPASLATARAHAAAGGLAVDYREGRAEALPVPAASYDVVACCDVLEHVDDWEAALAEIARVLRPGGVLVFDTPNRTWRSWLFTIYFAQRFPPTRFFPPDFHVWSRYVRPRELAAAARLVGLRVEDVRGMRLTGLPTYPLDLWRWRRGRLDYAELGARHAMTESRDTSVEYLGWARRL